MTVNIYAEAPKDDIILYKQIVLPTKLWNLNWKIVPVIGSVKGNNTYIRIEVELLHENQKPNSWRCDALITTHHIDENGREYTTSTHRLFDSFVSRHCIVRLLNEADIDNSVKETQLIVGRNQISVQIMRLSGFNQSVWEFTISKNIDSEVELHVGRHILYVDRYLLMSFSSTFREQLSQNNEDTIIFNNSNLSTVVTFLQLMYYPQGVEITKENVNPLLKLAKIYQVHFITEECVDFLISTHKFTIAKKLRFAEKYQLSKLQVEVLKSLTNEELMRLSRSITVKKWGGPTVRAVQFFYFLNKLQQCEMCFFS